MRFLVLSAAADSSGIYSFYYFGWGLAILPKIPIALWFRIIRMLSYKNRTKKLPIFMFYGKSMYVISFKNEYPLENTSDSKIRTKIFYLQH